MNYGDPDDTEIVSGDEGNLPPIHDLAIEANNYSERGQVIESSAQVSPSSEGVDQPVTTAGEGEPSEPQPSAETHFDVQSSLAEEPLVPVETVQSQPTTWQRVRNFLFGGSADVIARLNNLTQAIEDAPESAVNYVLRAELYMQIREYASAQSDFQRAYELSETQFELADWGFLEQAMRDRALLGLEKVQRRL